ncbi:MAG: ApaG domain [Klebsiella sp.]|nr:ApaG domain [Klebsiella sp.]
MFAFRCKASISNRSLLRKKSVTSSLGRSQVQLLGRYWLITNGHGRETEVQGEGVVGEQPHIPAGGEYQYTSGAVIETPLGTMQGHYEMIDIDGAPFRIEIPANAHSLKQCQHTLLATFTVATMN